MAVADIIIPFASEDPERIDNLKHVVTRLWRDYPTFNVLTGNPAPMDPWIKAVAVDRIIRNESTADILIIHDADVICDGLWNAVGAIQSGAPWAMPHAQLRRLDKASTAWWKDPIGPHTLTYADAPYRGHPGGGITVIRRSTWEQCPLDPRYVGWGQEDDSWAFALNLIAGHYYRGESPLIHLWHEPLPRMSRRHGSPESQALWLRYYRARHDLEAMTALLTEARELLDIQATHDAPTPDESPTS